MSLEHPSHGLTEALLAAYPELEPVAAAAEAPIFVVGGAVRDLLLGRPRGDLDLVVLGDVLELAARLGVEPRAHERFGTARVEVDGHEVDLARARTETYPEPGSLPVVSPAAAIEADLGRRDFTVNAIAVAVGGPERVVDPCGGRADLAGAWLRVLHERSFVDDPTRAIRAARYAARLGFAPEPETEALLRETDLATVSAERRWAELTRLAGEPSSPRGFELLAGWGLVDLREGGAELAAQALAVLDSELWRGSADRAEVVLRAALGPAGGEVALAATRPARPSQGVELAERCDEVELVLARALGAAWLDEYQGRWREAELQITGTDLLAAGVTAGPAVGAGLAAARRALLDGTATDRAAQLAVALRAAAAS